jgi:hypothetical protein
MANTTQPKVKTSTYTGIEAEDAYNVERTRPELTPVKSGSSTAMIVVLALAVVAALGYFYMRDTPATTTVSPAVTTQETAPAQPVPADPPAQTIQDPVPATPTPAPAPVAPAPVAPAN